MELTTERTYIRDIREEDYPFYYQLYSNSDTALRSGIKPLYSLEATILFLRRLIDREGMMLLSAFSLEGGSFIGTLSLTPKRSGSGLEIGYTISPLMRRKGYATEIAKAVISALPNFDRDHTINHFDLVIRSDNLPSIKTAKKLGFYPVEKRPHFYKNAELVYRLYV